MKQFLTIFKFEYKGFLKNKAFVGITIGIMILIAILLSFPRISGMFTSGDKETAKKETMAISSQQLKDQGYTLDLFKGAMKDKKIISVDASLDELKKEVESGKYESAVILTDPTNYTFITKSASIYDTTQEQIDHLLMSNYRYEAMQDAGITSEQASTILSQSIEGKVVTIGKDQTNSFAYTYILIFVLYMVIMLYGQMVATNVATEKSSRTMELLITSANTNHLIFGKILAGGLAGLTQVTAVFATAIGFFKLNAAYWDQNFFIDTLFKMPPYVIAFALGFFLLGYFIYAFMYGAIGSLASRTEDINTTILPVTFLFIAAFMVVMVSMNSGSVDSTLMKVASYVPFTSPMAMFVRVSMGNVSTIGIIISMIILVGSIVFIGYVSAAIYRVGVLLYGKPIKITEAIKLISLKGN